MSIAIEDDHLKFARVARQFLATRGGFAAARAALDEGNSVPAYWTELVELGWMGLHVDEGLGGSGFGLMEAAIIAEELGSVCAPGPFLSAVATSAAIASMGTEDQRRAFVPSLIDGSITAGIATRTDAIDRRNALHAEDVAVLSGGCADLFVLVLGDDLVLVDRDAPGVRVASPASVDPGLGFARVSCRSVEVAGDRVVSGGATAMQHALAVVAAAAAAGGAATCREMATEYAKDRIAFGQRIGQFQAVKHHCASMLVHEQLAIAASQRRHRRRSPALSAKWLKNVRLVRPALWAISATVTFSYPARRTTSWLPVSAAAPFRAPIYSRHHSSCRCTACSPVAALCAIIW